MSFQNENLDETYSELKKGVFCPFCGSKALDTDSFCVSCGASLTKKTDFKRETTRSYTKYTEEENIDKIPKRDQVQYAEFGERLLALIIDSIIISAIASVIGLGFSVSWGIRTSAISGGVGFLYYFLLEINNGQTFGKMVLKLQTLDAQTYGKITPAQGAIHAVGKAFFLPLDVFLGLITKKNFNSQESHKFRITQNVSKTIVIKK